MEEKRKPFKISKRLLIIVSVVFIIAGSVIIFLVNYHMRQQALAEAEEKARIILDHNLSTHTYFSHNLKPHLFTFTEPIRSPGYFEPTWMSSTYAIREIHNYFTAMGNSSYYYKECAVNARSPLNEADDYERSFIEELKANPGTDSKSDIRVLEGKPYFVVMRRGEVMEESCLRCHSTPDRAPAELVRAYGPERSFHRKTGDLVSAISIRIPLSEAYANANMLSLRLSGFFLATLSFLYAILLWLNNRFLFRPLAQVRDKALQISTVERHLGEKIPVPPGLELNELTTAFNTMSNRLRTHLDELEKRVQERTHELENMNNLLSSEIEERKLAEMEKERLIIELQDALAKVKTLSGFLPICSSCKKIRDDRGYWNQIEAFIKNYSNAEFTHGICPDCAKKLYPDIQNES